VKILLGRLIRKEAIRSERVEGRRAATPPSAAWTTWAPRSRALLDRLFEGRPEGLAAHLAERRGVGTNAGG
jgi:predicted transcriptional regulator